MDRKNTSGNEGSNTKVPGRETSLEDAILSLVQADGSSSSNYSATSLMCHKELNSTIHRYLSRMGSSDEKDILGQKSFVNDGVLFRQPSTHSSQLTSSLSSHSGDHRASTGFCGESTLPGSTIPYSLLEDAASSKSSISSLVSDISNEEGGSVLVHHHRLALHTLLLELRKNGENENILRSHDVKSDKREKVSSTVDAARKWLAWSMSANKDYWEKKLVQEEEKERRKCLPSALRSSSWGGTPTASNPEPTQGLNTFLERSFSCDFPDHNFSICGVSHKSPHIPMSESLQEKRFSNHPLGHWHPGTGLYACTICGMRFPTSQAVRGHRNAHRQRKVKCVGPTMPSPKKLSRKRSREGESFSEGAVVIAGENRGCSKSSKGTKRFGSPGHCARGREGEREQERSKPFEDLGKRLLQVNAVNAENTAPSLGRIQEGEPVKTSGQEYCNPITHSFNVVSSTEMRNVREKPCLDQQDGALSRSSTEPRCIPATNTPTASVHNLRQESSLPPPSNLSLFSDAENIIFRMLAASELRTGISLGMNGNAPDKSISEGFKSRVGQKLDQTIFQERCSLELKLQDNCPPENAGKALIDRNESDFKSFIANRFDKSMTFHNLQSQERCVPDLNLDLSL